jgi:hypothetical protein
MYRLGWLLVTLPGWHRLDGSEARNDVMAARRESTIPHELVDSHHLPSHVLLTETMASQARKRKTSPEAPGSSVAEDKDVCPFRFRLTA